MAPVVAVNSPNNQGKMSEIRRTSKHIMERKRRARINDSLLQLKGLVFPAIKKEGNGQPKMEKADILEMTVKHLQQQRAAGFQQLPNDGSQFRAGFSECIGEISKCLGACEDIDLEVKMRIMGHLSAKLSSKVSAQPCSPVLPSTPPPQAISTPYIQSPIQSISPAYRGQTECTVLPPNVACYPAVFITPPTSPVRCTVSPTTGVTSVRQQSFVKQQIVSNEPVWRPW
ncbi:transcription factor HES-4-B-like [Anneissia japonica]|uniref:transcription factor HES-4-B-like n=1 Tax=Anneissia japonica TaxID=1529436 RepID=UPI0014257F95|nr:transcription factor HES-4-B-like [Anneissia japonica]